MKAVVSIGFKPGVLDPEAQAIERALTSMGFEGVSGVRRTRVLEFELEAADRPSAEARAREMCERLLANPVIETYRVEITG